MRLREIEGATVSASLDATGESVRALLAERGVAQAEVDAEIVRAEERRKELEQERAAEHDIVDAAEQALDEARAAAQKALAADEHYRAAMAAAEGSDRVADLAEEKAKAAHTDRAEKGKPYDADPLFSIYGRAASVRRPTSAADWAACSTAGWRESRTSSRCAATTGC